MTVAPMMPSWCQRCGLADSNQSPRGSACGGICYSVSANSNHYCCAHIPSLAAHVNRCFWHRVKGRSYTLAQSKQSTIQPLPRQRQRALLHTTELPSLTLRAAVLAFAASSKGAFGQPVYLTRAVFEGLFVSSFFT